MSNAIISYVTAKHKNHANIISQLDSMYSVREIQIPAQNSGICIISKELENLAGNLDLIVIYLSHEIKDNVCIDKLVTIASARDIKVIGIWLDGEAIDSIPQSLNQTGDCITPYFEDMSKIFSGESSPWLTAEGTPFERRIIKKYIC